MIEIQKLIDKVVLNEQTRLVKQNVPEEELKKNQAYLENPKLYEQIKDSYKNNDEYKPKIEAQVEKNKAVLEEELAPPPGVKEDNILILRTLKLMHAKNIKRENSERYERIGSLLVDLEHLSYVVEVQKYIEEFSGGRISGERAIRRKNKEVYDAVKFMQKKGYKDKLKNIIDLRTERYLGEIKLRLSQIGDEGSRNSLEEINKGKDSLDKYRDKLTELRKLYEAKDEKYTGGDKYIIQYSKEQQGKNYGKKAISDKGQETALMVSKQSLFERFTNKLKSIFYKEPEKTGASYTMGFDMEETDSTAKREEVSPKANIDSEKANEAAMQQQPIEPSVEQQQGDF